MPGMSGLNTSRTRHPAWRTLVGLMLVLFAFRAMVPAGFMLGFSSEHGGHFGLVLCPGTTTASHGDHPDQQQALELCPFDLVTSQAILIPTLPLDPAPHPAYSTLAHARASAMPALMQGPPLGARAPPLRLG
jgi:hypothetical protein